jgi:hypothetical protein
MNGKVESCSNNQDEQDVNQDLKDNAAQVAAALDKKQNQRSPMLRFMRHANRWSGFFSRTQSC